LVVFVHIQSKSVTLRVSAFCILGISSTQSAGEAIYRRCCSNWSRRVFQSHSFGTSCIAR